MNVLFEKNSCYSSYYYVYFWHRKLWNVCINLKLLQRILFLPICVLYYSPVGRFKRILWISISLICLEKLIICYFFYLSDGLLYGLWIYPSFSLIYLEYGAFIKCALDVSVCARLDVFVHGLFNHEPRVVKTIICHSVRLPQRTFSGSFFECVFLFMLCTASWISTITKHC